MFPVETEISGISN